MPRTRNPPRTHSPVPLHGDDPPWKLALAEKVALVAENGLAPSTRSNYGSAVRRLKDFCQSHDVPQELQFPTDEFVLCAFAATLAGTKSGGTVSNQISGLKSWHAMNNYPWAGGTRLNYVLRGVSRLTPTSSKRAPRPPITSKMLVWLREGLDPELPFDAAVFAAASTAFWGQCRIGEILSSSRLNISNPDLPIIASIGPRTSSSGSRELHLPRTKTNQRDGQKIVLTRQDARIDAIRAITHLLKMNKGASRGLNLFIFRQGATGEFRALTKEAFLARCNEIWAAKGVPRLSGHSFRIGGTSELLDAGVPVDVVKAMGRWRSDAFHRYWRGISSLAPRHAEFVRTHDGENRDVAMPTAPRGSRRRARTRR